MKRFIIFFIATILALSMTLISSATALNGNAIEYNGYTIIFNVDSNFDEEQQQIIAQKVISNDITNDISATYNLMCTLFGHKTTTESITVIEHRVSDTQPRCRKSLQDVTGCTRCDYVTTSVVSATYIYCCE